MAPHRPDPRSSRLSCRCTARARRSPCPHRGRLLQAPPFEPPKGEVLEAGAIEVHARRQDRRRHSPRRNLDDRQRLRPTIPRTPSSRASPTACTKCSAWLRKTAGSTSPSAPTSRRIKDTNGDGKADLFEVVTDGWEINGDYHEYAFGSRFDKDGNIWITLCLTGSFNSNSKFRGWARQGHAGRQIRPHHQRRALARRRRLQRRGRRLLHRQPGPLERRLRLKQLTVGGFVGHPDSFKWYKEPEAKYLGDAPLVPKSGSRIMTEAKRIPQLVPPAVHLPLRQDGPVGQRHRLRPLRRQVRPLREAAVRRRSDAQHGHARLPGKGQRPLSGRVLPVPRRASARAIVPVRFAKDGSLFVGGTNRGWGSRGTKPFAVERLVWTGKTPFEIHEMRAKPDGFELTFTKPVDPETAGKVESYKMKTFTYIYQADYGSPEVDRHDAEDHQGRSRQGRQERAALRRRPAGRPHPRPDRRRRPLRGRPAAACINKAYYTLNYFATK